MEFAGKKYRAGGWLFSCNHCSRRFHSLKMAYSHLNFRYAQFISNLRYALKINAICVLCARC